VDSSKYWEEARVSLKVISEVSKQVEDLMLKVRNTGEIQTRAASDAVTEMGKLSQNTSKFRTSINETEKV
jgi:hypothetical protein